MFLFKISFLFRELILITFIRISLRVRDYFSFSSSKNIFIYLLFLKDIFVIFRICSRQFFSFSIWNMIHHFFLASLVSDKKTTVNFIEGNLYIKSFSLAVFNIFLFLWLLTVWPKCYDCKFFSLSHWEFVELIRYAD